MLVVLVDVLVVGASLVDVVVVLVDVLVVGASVVPHKSHFFLQFA